MMALGAGQHAEREQGGNHANSRSYECRQGHARATQVTDSAIPVRDTLT